MDFYGDMHNMKKQPTTNQLLKPTKLVVPPLQEQCPRNHCCGDGYNHKCLGIMCWCGKEHKYTFEDVTPHKEANCCYYNPDCPICPKKSTPTQETEEWIEKIKEIPVCSWKTECGDQHGVCFENLIPFIRTLLTQREEAVRERINKSVMEIVIKESKLGCVCDYKLASYFASLTPKNKENL